MKSTSRDKVILVDKDDNAIGVADKLLAHQHGGSRHRAFSIFILNEKNEILLQQRASTKYHAANLWSNTCCSHPQPNESIKLSAQQRLKEELGLKADLHHIGTVEYKTEVTENLTEWEIDHLFLGRYNGQTLSLNPAEVSDIRWITIDKLLKNLEEEPKHFTPWLAFILPQLKNSLECIHIE
jgi:isopentenyl-diphosphate delta-isomerase